jgi:hypothetical protein
VELNLIPRAAQTTDNERSRALVALVVAIAVLALAACGGSSPTNAQSSAYASGAGGFTSPEAAVRRCLHEHAVLPLRRSRSLFLPGDTLAARIRQASSSNNFTAALRGCGVGSAHGPTLVEVLLPPKTLMKFLAAWTACIAKNGYNLPTPNVSGSGPVFAVGTDRVGRYRAAATHCASIERREVTAIRLAEQS